ncbi:MULTISPECIES: WXG100 family type VII secretion target [Streptomycetaceae]|uniref:ESAT-6-like protein n=1 Tax=Streptantibioticus cattleyicolor (strain ATCC 35852 / DSM 46488 / JCM 4925 / NBRC 14057 / NRRL 8057) TaxID=1003195 RepID=F8JUN8_STREN|nr:MULTISPECIES: WXG100 family type VII secretion target [Streptomycetaceae]AEW96867.1 hypothetical protein SCATT_44960 [Streptantibioticus cattleyicolor NRRL 8057 = DSM 46488]MYS61345.1 WXG100 family type VII secretion target [Streptomyces sp. SID5468]CCB77196.1 conserved protein of unknown function [Streptantibioticus cattleyicolor NRRL 8057 = DSM 46488]
MAGDLDVERHDLTTLSNRLQSMQTTLEQQVRALQNMVDTVKAGWKGAGGSAFQHLQTEVNQDVEKLKGYLQRIKEAVDASNRGYTARDEEEESKYRRAAAGGGDILSRLG